MFIDDEEGTDDAYLTRQTLLDTQEKLGALLEFLPSGLIIHQMQGILYANPQAVHLLGVPSDQLFGQHFLDFVSDDVREQFSELFMRSFMAHEPVHYPEMSLRGMDGQIRHVRAHAGQLPWDGTSVVQIILEDITELRQQTEELRRLSLFDPLTGAYNRRFFIEQASKVIQHAQAEHEAFSLLIFDVDWFKQVNDTYGHLAGDEALKSIMKVWDTSSRHNDSERRDGDGKLARIGGEEFAVLLPATPLSVAQKIAERFRENISAHTVEFEHLKFNVTASFGVTTMNANDRSLDDLIRRADLALYRAKESGRNRVETA